MGSDLGLKILDTKMQAAQTSNPFSQKPEDLEQKHELQLMLKLEVELKTLTDPPESFNLRIKKFC